MISVLRSEQAYATARVVVMLLLLGACFLWGGASRLDVPGLILLQPFAVICLAAFLMIPGTLHLQLVHGPLLLLLALAIAMTLQLVPLPPEIWMKLPGQAAFGSSIAAAGLDLPWRPISVTPDLTLSSIVSLVVPFAILIGFASLPRETTYQLLPFLLAGVAFSVVLGLAQLTSGGRESFYFYRITNLGAGVGVFANRNHQAVLLAMAFPMLALWAGMTAKEFRHDQIRRGVALAAGLFLLPMLAVTGSRAGLLLGLIGLGFAWWLYRNQRLRRSHGDVGGERFGRLRAYAPIFAGVFVIVVAVLLARAEAFDRLFMDSVAEDPRTLHAPVVAGIVKDFFPFGSGFGSFDQIYRHYEPFDLLRPSYFNHAHNDLLELAMTGGLPALLILAALGVWLASGAMKLIRGRSRSRSDAFAILGLAMIAILLTSSLLDYPLRTPLLSSLFAIACGWLSAQGFEFKHDTDQSFGPGERALRTGPQTLMRHTPRVRSPSEPIFRERQPKGRFMKWWLLLCGIAVAGCSTPQMTNTGEVGIVPAYSLPAPTRADLSGNQRAHLLGPFDKVSVEVFGIQELSRTVQVDADGRVALPIAGTIVATGSTPEELARAIEERLRSGYVKDPHVTVGVVDTVSQVVTVDGAVEEPGIYPVIGDMTLMRAVARAKGVTDTANTNHVVLFRTVEGQPMAALYDLRAIRQGAYKDPKIYPRDVVVVGESQARRVFPQILQGATLLLTPLITLLNTR